MQYCTSQGMVLGGGSHMQHCTPQGMMFGGGSDIRTLPIVLVVLVYGYICSDEYQN